MKDRNSACQLECLHKQHEQNCRPVDISNDKRSYRYRYELTDIKYQSTMTLYARAHNIASPACLPTPTYLRLLPGT